MEYQLISTDHIQAIQYVNDLDENGVNIPIRDAVAVLGLKEAWKDKDHIFGTAIIFDGEKKMEVPYEHWIVKAGEVFTVFSPETMALYQPVTS